jgi:hypothetical protein
MLRKPRARDIPNVVREGFRIRNLHDPPALYHGKRRKIGYRPRERILHYLVGCRVCRRDRLQVSNSVDEAEHRG